MTLLGVNGMKCKTQYSPANIRCIYLVVHDKVLWVPNQTSGKWVIKELV